MSSPILLITSSFLLVDCDQIQSSISHYYYTPARGVLVGSLCAVAVLLFIYKGYSRTDNILSNVACLSCLGVAFFPTAVDPHDLTTCVNELVEHNIFSLLHACSAAGQFITLGYLPLFIFCRTHKNAQPTPQKLIRNKVYKICGITMYFTFILIVIYVLGLQGKYPELDYCNPVLALEALALIAFGFSWLIKGEAFFKDKV